MEYWHVTKILHRYHVAALISQIGQLCFLVPHHMSIFLLLFNMKMHICTHTYTQTVPSFLHEFLNEACLLYEHIKYEISRLINPNGRPKTRTYKAQNTLKLYRIKWKMSKPIRYIFNVYPKVHSRIINFLFAVFALWQKQTLSWTCRPRFHTW